MRAFPHVTPWLSSPEGALVNSQGREPLQTP